jgi:Flp pilus assembly protein TadD
LLRAASEHLPNSVTLTVATVKMLAASPVNAERTEAVQIGEQACERTGFQNAQLLDATALAQFRAGQPDQAVETARRALEVATQQGLTDLADRIRNSLSRYEGANRP